MARDLDDYRTVDFVDVQLKRERDADAQRRRRADLKRAGYKGKTVWLHDDDWQRAKQLQECREIPSAKTSFWSTYYDTKPTQNDVITFALRAVAGMIAQDKLPELLAAAATVQNSR